LPFEDNQYDVILCHVLEHIQMTLKQCKVSRLKAWRDGHLQIPQELSRAVTFSDDTITDQNAKIFGQYDHVRIYGRRLFLTRA
jgi:predicted SAM-dependent methyltransferase